MKNGGRPTDLYSGLTAGRVRTLFRYFPETGHFIRLVRTGTKAKIGSRAGTHLSNKYRTLTIDGRVYLEHRIAWLYVYGAWPIADIDHINRDRADNRLCNLREATRGQNNINSKKQHNNTSGFKGAYYDKRRDCWYAEIWVNNKKVFLGRHESAENAGAAYRNAAKQYFGVFAESPT